MSESAEFYLPLDPAPAPTPATVPLDRLITQYKNKPRLRALLKSYLDELDEVAVAIEQVRVAFRLGDAIGAQLDILGKIVGAMRQGLVDADYELLIRAYVRAQKSEGKPEDLYAVFRILLDGTGEIVLDEYYPMSLVFGFFRDSSFSHVVLGQLLELAEPQGVDSQLVYGRHSGAFQFAPGDTAVVDANKGLGITSDPARGGRLAGGL